jgi:ABC-type cobalamin/Fe3+-siderophores transport system ATPase subunit
MDEILNCENGSRCLKCDLHVHTPISRCYKEKEIQPIDIVNTAIDKELDIVAITDHNSEGWFSEIFEAAKDKELLVLPGVEITTPQGGERQVHMLAIFDYPDFKKVDELLTKVGIPHENRGKSDVVAIKSILEIMEIVNDLGGISILAHVDSNCGIDVEMPRKTPLKKQILDSEHLSGIEITDTKSIENFSKHPCIFNSDSHSLDELARRYTYIKMGKPSFEGLRLALGDYESRIKLSNLDMTEQPHIIGIKFDGGFLDGQIIRFNKNLNCLIGGKGTGKSTIIELTRYALNNLSKDEKLVALENEHIKSVLGDGKIRVYLKIDASNDYIVEREYGTDPVIFRGNGEEIDLDIEKFEDDFFKIEVYSQTELLEIARNFENQLKMIDQYVNLKDLDENKQTVLRQLDRNKTLIVENQLKIEDLNSKISELKSIDEKLKSLEDRGIKEKLEKHLSWKDEMRVLSNLKTEIIQLLDEKKELQSQFEEKNIFEIDSEKLEQMPNKSDIEKMNELVQNANSYVGSKINEIITALEGYLAAAEEICKEWNEKYKEEQIAFQSLLEDFEENGIPIKEFKDYLELESQRQNLKDEIGRMKDIESQIIDLKDARHDTIKELSSVRKETHKRRNEVIKSINSCFSSFVKIKIEFEGDNASYVDYLTNVALSSNDIRIQKRDREKVAENVHPLKLAQIILDENISYLVDEVDLSEEIARKVIDLGKNKLFDIQTICLEDRVNIQLNDKGWKDISSCSDGQKCTAILAIAMFERNVPLIIDQPEDSLDNSFIYNQVVKVMRDIKNKRQVIVATHNANIPVLGDSELMVVMTSNGRNGFIRERGVIDDNKIKVHVQNILEGGKEAFEKRKQKYGF